MIVVYTAILGGSDSLKPAPVGADRAVCFTNAELDQSLGWELKPWVVWAHPDSRREAWRLRSLPHTLFDDYRTVIWIDGSFTMTNLPKLLDDTAGYPFSGFRHHKRKSCYEEGKKIIEVGQADAGPVHRQLEAYRREEFRPTKLTITCLLVRSNAPKVHAFNEAWYAETQKHRGDNTQISVDYAAWKTGLPVHTLTGNHKGNLYAEHDAADHKQRRRPYER